MADKAPTRTDGGYYVLWQWDNIDKDDRVLAAEVDINPSELIVQYGGALGGSTLTVEGSLDNGIYTGPLNGYFGSPIEISYDSDDQESPERKGGAIREYWRYIKPVLKGGDEQQNSEILLFARKRESTAPDEAPD